MTTSSQEQETLGALMQRLGRGAVEAAAVLAQATSAMKDEALARAAQAIRAHADAILAANERDRAAARAAGLSAALLDRLMLDRARVEAMASGIEAIIRLPDPVGTIAAQWQRPNGLTIQRVRVPLGVIGIIYESRPNVTADAGALCVKSGNAVILRGGSESSHSNAAIHRCLTEGLAGAGLPRECIQRVPTTDRAAVGYMLAGMTEYLDVIVPRGGKSLADRGRRLTLFEPQRAPRATITAGARARWRRRTRAAPADLCGADATDPRPVSRASCD